MQTIQKKKSTIDGSMNKVEQKMVKTFLKKQKQIQKQRLSHTLERREEQEQEYPSLYLSLSYIRGRSKLQNFSVALY